MVLCICCVADPPCHHHQPAAKSWPMNSPLGVLVLCNTGCSTLHLSMQDVTASCNKSLSKPLHLQLTCTQNLASPQGLQLAFFTDACLQGQRRPAWPASKVQDMPIAAFSCLLAAFPQCRFMSRHSHIHSCGWTSASMCLRNVSIASKSLPPVSQCCSRLGTLLARCPAFLQRLCSSMRAQ